MIPSSLPRRSIAAIIALGLVTVACSSTGSSPSSPSASSAASHSAEIGPPEQTSITVIAERDAFSAQQNWLISDANGYYKDEGLTVKVIASDDPRAAIVGGSGDVAGVNPGEVADGINAGLDLIIFSGLTCRQQYTFASAPDVDDVSDLAGKDVLLASTNGDPEYNARKRVLKDNGWDLDKTTPNYVFVAGGSTVWAKLFTGGKLFLMPVFSRVRPSIEAYGGNIIVEKLVPLPNQVMFAKKSWYEKNPNTAARFLRATIKGTQFLLDQPKNKDAVIAIGEKFGFDMSPEKKNTATYALSQESNCANQYFAKEAWQTLEEFQGLDPTPFDKIADITQMLRAQAALGLDNSTPPEIPFP